MNNSLYFVILNKFDAKYIKLFPLGQLEDEESIMLAEKESYSIDDVSDDEKDWEIRTIVFAAGREEALSQAFSIRKKVLEIGKWIPTSCEFLK